MGTGNCDTSWMHFFQRERRVCLDCPPEHALSARARAAPPGRATRAQRMRAAGARSARARPLRASARARGARERGPRAPRAPSAQRARTRPPAPHTRPPARRTRARMRRLPERACATHAPRARPCTARPPTRRGPAHAPCRPPTARSVLASFPPACGGARARVARACATRYIKGERPLMATQTVSPPQVADFLQDPRGSNGRPLLSGPWRVGAMREAPSTGEEGGRHTSGALHASAAPGAARAQRPRGSTPVRARLREGSGGLPGGRTRRCAGCALRLLVLGAMTLMRSATDIGNANPKSGRRSSELCGRINAGPHHPALSRQTSPVAPTLVSKSELCEAEPG